MYLSGCRNKRENEEYRKNMDGRYKEGYERKNLDQGQWEDRKRWSLGLGQRTTAF